MFFSYNTIIILPSKAKKTPLMRGFFIFSLKEKKIYMHGWAFPSFSFLNSKITKLTW